MVLVAPRPLLRPAPRGDAPAWDHGTGAEVLALLRGDAASWPRFDAGLAGGLRAWLEDAAYDVVAARGEQAPPLFLGPASCSGTHDDVPDGAPEGGAPGDRPCCPAWCTRCSARLVQTGEVHDPLSDALDALRAAGATTEVRRVEALPEPARAALGETVALHARNLGSLVPRFAPGWMPRTNDRVAIPLAGGRIVLHGMFDLVVGLPQPGTASLCALGLSTDGPWAVARRSLHYLSLLETLRSGAPPFRLALLESATGRYGVEDVREEHLRAIASHIAAWLEQATVPWIAGSWTRSPRRSPRSHAASWRAALDEAKGKLAGLAVRRAGAARFRVTDHEVRTAFAGHGHGDDSWGGPVRLDGPHGAALRRGRRRARCWPAGTARSPMEAVRDRMAESTRWVREGSSSATQLDRWIESLAPAGRAAVGAEAVDLGHPPVVRPRLVRLHRGARGRSRPLVGQPPFRPAGAAGPGRRPHGRGHTWSCSRGPAGRRCGRSWPWSRWSSPCAPRGDAPGRVVGWWPDSGRLVRVEPEPAALTLGAEAVELALGAAGTTLRPAA